MRVKAGMTGKEMRPMMKRQKASVSQRMALDRRVDRTMGWKEGSKEDNRQDRALGIKDKKVYKKKRKSGPIQHTGTFQGKSNRLGQGGRAAQMRARGVPGGVIGNIARREEAAPGQRNYHKA